MSEMTPIGALVRGAVAGAFGAWVQNRFFELTGELAPPQVETSFDPPEPQQAEEQPTQTVARRFVEGFMTQGPLDDEQKSAGGQVVHYGFGATWGAVYGLARATFPAVGGTAGLLGFSTGVWLVGDVVILPAFRLSAPATEYPVQNHAYALVAHVAYGAGVLAAWRLLSLPVVGTVLTGAGVALAASSLTTLTSQRANLPRDTRRRAEEIEPDTSLGYDEPGSELPI